MATEFNSNIEALFGKLDNFITTKTVVGEPLTIGDVILLPLVDVNFGLGAGAMDKDEDKSKKEFDGGGVGATITPSAVIVVQNGNVQLVNVKNQDSINKLIDMVPGILSKLNLDSLLKKDKSEKNNEEDIKKTEKKTDIILDITEVDVKKD